MSTPAPLNFFEQKHLRAARNACRLLGRRDARSVRRCKYWIRQYGWREFTPEQLRRPQVPYDLVVLAYSEDPSCLTGSV